jgi:hypothetical protein
MLTRDSIFAQFARVLGADAAEQWDVLAEVMNTIGGEIESLVNECHTMVAVIEGHDRAALLPWQRSYFDGQRDALQTILKRLGQP